VRALSADLDSISVDSSVGLDHRYKMLLDLSTCSRNKWQEEIQGTCKLKPQGSRGVAEVGLQCQQPLTTAQLTGSFDRAVGLSHLGTRADAPLMR